MALPNSSAPNRRASRSTNPSTNDHHKRCLRDNTHTSQAIGLKPPATRKQRFHVLVILATTICLCSPRHKQRFDCFCSYRASPLPQPHSSRAPVFNNINLYVKASRNPSKSLEKGAEIRDPSKTLGNKWKLNLAPAAR